MSKGNPNGRPPVFKPGDKSDHQLKNIMRYKPRLEDVAAFFECNSSTVERYIKKTYGVTFAEFRLQNQVRSRFEMIQVAMTKALQGDNTMLIFCLKNQCGWADKIDETISNPEGKKFQLAYNLNKEPSGSDD